MFDEFRSPEQHEFDECSLKIITCEISGILRPLVEAVIIVAVFPLACRYRTWKIHAQSAESLVPERLVQPLGEKIFRIRLVFYALFQCGVHIGQFFL